MALENLVVSGAINIRRKPGLDFKWPELICSRRDGSEVQFPTLSILPKGEINVPKKSLNFCTSSETGSTNLTP